MMKMLFPLITVAGTYKGADVVICCNNGGNISR